MSYSITPVLHNRKDNKGLQKLIIQVIYKRAKVYVSTDYKLRSDQWAGMVINHASKTKINAAVVKRMEEIEGKVIDIIATNPSKEKLAAAVKATEPKSKTVFDYIFELAERYRGKLSPGSLNHYRSLAHKIEAREPGVKFSSVSVQWMEHFEAHLRRPFKSGTKTVTLDNNTISSNMKRLKGLFAKARKDGHLKEEAYREYVVPLYRQKLFDFLEEPEIDTLFKLVRNIENEAHKLTGYYFLLSCKAGYRISDLRAFDYNKRVVNNSIILRAGKNAKIVSIPIYPSLAEVLEYIKDKPFNLSERNASDYLKTLCSLSGIKKKVSFHTGRRTWAMTLLSNGFTIDEVADSLGDSKDVARVYAQMNNTILAKKINERMK